MTLLLALALPALQGCTGTDAPDDGALPCASCDDTGVPDTDTDADTDTDSDTDTDTDSDTDTDTDTDTSVVDGPRHVILFVGDGMGLPHVEGGGLYAYGAAGSLVMESLPYSGRLLTASLSGTTDSAAGATALSTGHKTWNHVVAMDSDYAVLETVLERARARGLAAGVVTTDTLTGATPASFFSHAESRGDSLEITTQLLADPPEVVLGGGMNYLEEPLLGADVQLVTTRSELLAAEPDGRPFMGVFASSTFPYVVDGYGDTPSIAEMTAYALNILDDDPDGFFLIVEGARIDHASHGNDGDAVHLETAAFDEAVAAAVGWAAAGGHDPTVVVTADHECGGLHVSGGGTAGEVPDSEWRWGDHTNADIPVFGMGPHADTLDGQRLDNTWVNAVLSAAVDGAATVTAPVESLLVDGRTTDLGPPVTTQAWETSFGVGFNQLDALRITADGNGLYIGVDGVFEFGENAVFVLIDIDYGAGTGWGAEEMTLADMDGTLDSIVTALPYTSGVAGLGFELAFGSVGAQELTLGDLSDVAGIRGYPGAWGAADDYWWLLGTSNFDFGNLAGATAAVDAGATGLTENGWEIQIPWFAIYGAGLPTDGLSIAVVAVLANEDGTYASNQALPPLASDAEPGTSVVLLESAVLLEVDGSGIPVASARVVP